MAYSLVRTEKIYVVEETDYATEVLNKPDTNNAIPVINAVIKPAQTMLARKDKLGVRTMPQPIAGGNISMGVDIEAYVIPNGTVATVPMCHMLLKNLLGSTATINTTWSSGNATTFVVADITGIAAGTILSWENEMRPVLSVVVNTRTVTLAIAFSSTPSGSDPITGVTYKLADTAANSLAVYSYKTNLAQVALGCLFNRCGFSFVDEMLHMRISGIGQQESVAPAVTSAPTPTFTGLPVARSFGAVYVAGAAAQLVDFSVDVDNGDVPREVPIGSQLTLGISRGDRRVTDNFRVYLTDSFNAFYATAKARTPQSIFVQIGNVSGKMVGFYIPNRILQIPDIDKSKEEALLDFKSNPAYGTGSDEFYMAIG